MLCLVAPTYYLPTNLNKLPPSETILGWVVVEPGLGVPKINRTQVTTKWVIVDCMWKRTQSRSEMTFSNDRGVEKDCGTISSSDWFPLSEINQTTRHRVDNSLFGQEIVNYSLSLAGQSNWSCSRGCPLLVVDMIFNPQRSPMVQWRSTMVRCNSEGCLRSMTKI